MDITRNWRLKQTRTQLLATRCPETGAVMLPQQTASNTRAQDVYVFTPIVQEVEIEEASAFVRAAR